MTPPSKSAIKRATTLVNSREFAWADYLETDLVKIRDLIALALDEAVREERERAAMVALKTVWPDDIRPSGYYTNGWIDSSEEIARRIRKEPTS